MVVAPTKCASWTLAILMVLVFYCIINLSKLQSLDSLQERFSTLSATKSLGKDTLQVSDGMTLPTCGLRDPHRFAGNSSNSGGSGPIRIERIFFLHMQKAGGTTLRGYLREATKQYSIDWHEREGEMKDTHWERVHEATTFSITHVREPIARLISQYKYNRRWDCHFLLEPKFNPTLHNQYMSFDEFIHQKHRAYRGFDCFSAECMSRWATGTVEYPNWVMSDYGKKILKVESNRTINSPLDLETYSKRLLEKTLEALSKFDFIIVLEWLQDPTYVSQLEHFFGVDKRVLENRPEKIFCGNESIHANLKYPLIVKDEWIDALKETNKVDLALYEILTTSPTCSQASDVDLGDRTLKDLTT